MKAIFGVVWFGFLLCSTASRADIPPYQLMPGTGSIYVANIYPATTYLAADVAANVLESCSGSFFGATGDIDFLCNGVVINASTGMVYLFGSPNGHTGNVLVYNDRTNSIVTELTLPGTLIRAAVDEGLNKVYFLSSNSVVVLDGTSNTVTATIPVGGFDIAVDPTMQQVWIDAGAQVTVVDEGSDAVNSTISLPVSSESAPGVAAVAIDGALGRAYFQGDDPTGTFSELVIVDTATQAVVESVPMPLGGKRLKIGRINHAILSGGQSLVAMDPVSFDVVSQTNVNPGGGVASFASPQGDFTVGPDDWVFLYGANPSHVTQLYALSNEMFSNVVSQAPTEVPAGTAFTVTTQVSPTDGGGTVTIYYALSGGQDVQPAACQNLALQPVAGVATVSCTIPGLPGGSFVNVISQYTGDASYYALTEADSTVNIQAATTLSLSPSSVIVQLDQGFEFDAVPYPSDGTGTVSFTSTVASSATPVPIAGCTNVTLGPWAQPNVARCVVSSFPVGQYTVTAAFSGSTYYQPSSATSLLTVTKIPTAMSAKPVLSGGGLSATLTAEGSGLAGEPIKFTAGGRVLCSSVLTQSDGTASCYPPIFRDVGILLSGGFSASYSGDATYLPSSAKAPVLGN